jgi:hypothetical protein
VNIPAHTAGRHPTSGAVELKIAAAPSALPSRTAHIVNRGRPITHGVPQVAERMHSSELPLDLIETGRLTPADCGPLVLASSAAGLPLQMPRRAPALAPAVI